MVERVLTNFTEARKTRLIKAEIERLAETFEAMGADELALHRNLVESAAFLSVVLKDLEISIKRDGVVSEYQNGPNQWGTKKSPEVETYANLAKLYKEIIKQLGDKLPPVAVTEADDGFDDFRESG